jgi:hypothetical protein
MKNEPKKYIKIGSYLTGDVLHLHYKNHHSEWSKETIAVSHENRTKHVLVETLQA